MFFRRRKALWLTLMAMLALGALALAATRPGDQEGKIVAPPNNPAGPVATFLPIALRRGGFVPGELTRPAGNYYISVSNLTGIPELLFRLERENGERLNEVKVAGRRQSWRQHIRLAPGTYLLTEVGHPGWVCRITVTPQ